MIDIDPSWECIAVYGPVQYSTVQYSTVQYITVQYSIYRAVLARSPDDPQRTRVASVFTVHYSTVQYSTVQYYPQSGPLKSWPPACFFYIHIQS